MSDVKQAVPSVIEYFYHWERTTPNAPFLRQPFGDDWRVMSYAEAGQEARKMLTALEGLGLTQGDHIGLSSKNCMHWILADLAILMGGMVSVPFYSSLPTPQFEEVIQLADLKAIFLGRHDKWGDKSSAIPADMPVVRFPHYQGDAEVDTGLNWDSLVAQNVASDSRFAPDLEDLWTIKFTSGTTGTPKGVMLKHRNPAMIMHDEKESNWIGMFNLVEPKFFSFLPLNHVGERMAVEVPAITLGANISFAENLATFANNIQATQPSMLFAVPRIWTLFYQGVIEKMPEKKLNFLLKLPIVGKRVKQKIRAAIGLSDIQVAATGAAITPAFVKDFYKKLDIHLIEAYGMTETTGSFTNGPDLDTPSDSVGRPIPNAEVKIDEESGEILMKTPYMMAGYYKAPEKTAEVLKDGWLHSGDKGVVDANGYLRVTGRVKDAFKTAKGSYVTPNPLEEAIMKNDYVEQVCVAGIGIPQPIALLNLSESGKTADRSTVESSVLETVESLNKTRANFERISTAVIQNEAWSPDNGILTPTLKIKRSALDERFSPQYLNWHEAPEKVIWD